MICYRYHIIKAHHDCITINRTSRPRIPFRRNPLLSKGGVASKPPHHIARSASRKNSIARDWCGGKASWRVRSILVFYLDVMSITPMIISWYGQSCFKIQSGELVIAIDPFAKDIGLTPPRFRADIVLVTHAHKDHANVQALAGTPFVVSGPGEYEIKDVHVHGIETFHDDREGALRGLNTVYVLSLEGIHIVHMGDFGEPELRNATLEAIGNVDILILPVGSVYTIDARSAAKIVNQIEPAYAIPMHYRIPGLTVQLDTVDAFLKEIGSHDVKPQDRFAVKKKDIADGGEKTQIVLLEKL